MGLLQQLIYRRGHSVSGADLNSLPSQEVLSNNTSNNSYQHRSGRLRKLKVTSAILIGLGLLVIAGFGLFDTSSSTTKMQSAAIDLQTSNSQNPTVSTASTPSVTNLPPLSTPNTPSDYSTSVTLSDSSTGSSSNPVSSTVTINGLPVSSPANGSSVKTTTTPVGRTTTIVSNDTSTNGADNHASVDNHTYIYSSTNTYKTEENL